MCTVDYHYEYVVVGACYFNDKCVWLFVPNECVNFLLKRPLHAIYSRMTRVGLHCTVLPAMAIHLLQETSLLYTTLSPTLQSRYESLYSCVKCREGLGFLWANYF